MTPGVVRELTRQRSCDSSQMFESVQKSADEVPTGES